MGKIAAMVDVVVRDINEFVRKKDAIEQEINQELGQLVYNDIDQIFIKGIDEFYGSYSPIYYTRTRALYEVYELIIRDEVISLDVGGEHMPASHRADNGYIYDLVFKQGYHGGSNVSGVPMWRTPPALPGVHPYTSWGRPAVRSTAPYDLIWGYLDDYENSGAIQSYADSIVPRIIGKYMNL